MKSICLVISDSQDLQGEFGIVGLLQRDFIPRSPAVHFMSLVWGFQSICTIAGHIFVFLSLKQTNINQSQPVVYV